MSSQLEYDIFGCATVYPGHPNAIALIIMEKYPSYEAALDKPEDKQSAAALRDGDIPGAGGNVYSALDVLEKLVKDGPEAAFEAGNKMWARMVGPGSGNHEKSFEEGQKQVDAIARRFLDKASSWDHSTQTLHVAEKLIQATPDASPPAPAKARPRI